jgi:hypothetical protein
MASKKITVHSVDADVMNIPLTMQGNIGYAGEPGLSLDMNVKDLNLANIRDFSAQFLPEGMTLDGNISCSSMSAKSLSGKTP